MRERKVTALYCDHCNKRGFQRPRMAKHEKSCTANPNRECGMCEWMHENDGQLHHGKSVSELCDVIGDGGKEGLKRLREASNNCPACMLAAIRFMHSSEKTVSMDTGFAGFVDCLPSLPFEWVVERDRWNKVSAGILNEQQWDGGYY